MLANKRGWNALCCFVFGRPETNVYVDAWKTAVSPIVTAFEDEMEQCC